MQIQIQGSMPSRFSGRETWTVPAYLELPCVTDGRVNIISFSICSCMCLKVLASNCFQISTLESDYTFLPSIVTGGIVPL